jgi:hypothetical protein
VGDFKGLFQVARHPGFRLGNPEFSHHEAKSIPVFRQIDRIGRRPEDGDSRLCQLRRQVERRLPAELHDHSLGLLLLKNA